MLGIKCDKNTVSVVLWKGIEVPFGKGVEDCEEVLTRILGLSPICT